MSTKSRLRRVVAALALAGGCGAALALPAGRVLIAVGDVSAVRDGVSIKLAKDSPVESGDTVVTGVTSNAQLRFTDGSIVALRPETQFQIENYSFHAADAGANQNRGIFGLIKGGLRTVTGLIGKKDREAYSMKTPVATIGIRGTHYNLVLCQQSCRNNDGSLSRDGVYGSVLDGAIAMKNKAQERVFGKDEVFFVPDASTPPVKLLAPPSFLRDKLDGQARSRQNQQGEQAKNGNGGEKQQATEKAPSEAKAPETRSEPTKTEAPVSVPTPPIQLAEDSLTDVVKEASEKATSGTADGVYPTSGNTLGALTVNSQPGANGGEIWYASQRLLPVSFDADGLKQIANWCGGACPAERVTATLHEAGADGGTVAWGRWSGGLLDFGAWGRLNYGTDQGVHFVVGAQTATLPTADLTVRYNLIGATSPTNNTNSLLTTGAVTASGYLDVNFATRAISTQFDVTGSNAGFRITGSTANFTSADFSLNGTTTRTSGTAALCTAGCATTIYGSFFGTGATHAGTVYRASDAVNGLVEGAAVFKK